MKSGLAIAEWLRGRDDVSEPFHVRITSYNVCYTKLLRLCSPNSLIHKTFSTTHCVEEVFCWGYSFFITASNESV